MIKKLFLLVNLVLLNVSFSYSQEDTIYSFSFTETGLRWFDFIDRDTGNYFFIDTTQFNNIWEIGKPLKTIFKTREFSPLALVTDSLNNYPINNISSFTFTIKSDNLTHININHQIDADSLNDGGIVEFSLDGGTSWKNILSWPEISNFHGLFEFYNDTSMISSNSDKPGFTGTSGIIFSTIFGEAMDYVKFRFTFSSDSINSNKNGWMIKEISIFCFNVGLEEARKNNPIQVFPNPTSDLISFRILNSEPINYLELRDIYGKILLTSNQTELDLSQFKSGIYFVTISTNKGDFVTKVYRK